MYILHLTYAIDAFQALTTGDVFRTLHWIDPVEISHSFGTAPSLHDKHGTFLTC